MAKKKTRRTPIAQSRGVKFLAVSIFAITAVALVAVADARGNRLRIQIPSQGATVSGVEPITLKDRRGANLRKTTLNIRVNGVPVPASDDCVFIAQYEPGIYHTCWDTTQFSNGDYQLSVDLVRRNGRVIASSPISVTIQNEEDEFGIPDKVHAAYFKMIDPSRPNDEFIFGLDDEAQIAQARAAIGTNKIVNGVLLLEPVEYNPDWSYHYDSATIELVDTAFEVCDSWFQFVEDHLDEVGGSFLPNNRFCPWNAPIVEEVDPFNP